MLQHSSWRFWPIVAALAMVLGACQGNLGSGSGIGIPQGAQYTPPPGAPVSGTGSQSRQHVVEGAVYLSADSDKLPLPAVDGFALEIALGTAPPSASPAPSASATAGAKAAVRRTRTTDGRIGTATAGPSGAPESSASATPAASLTTGAPPSGAPPSGSPASGPPASGPPASGPPASGAPSANPAPSGAKTATKTTVYPGDAPAAPTPQPTGSVQTFLARTALVRGFVQPSSDIALYGLGALHFTIPKAEATSQRGFTIALFSAGKKHHDALLAFDPEASAVDVAVASSLSAGPIVLKKGTGYLLLLYGDELPAAPASLPSGYPAPGNNPFFTSNPASSGVPAPGGQAGPGATPLPGASNLSTFAPH